ncbi:MAG: single-stranded DNA-binding protein [Spirochaetia bacterium]|nr:single-stranded DNA-binding protein [Spirochaetota bacterium]MCX8097180.1 single-stranded DNA-binding protein [Spirochaetota bacterium]MDW8112647.1 single-stranded DNA-binding protein [Spirochaetia bacterium]
MARSFNKVILVGNLTKDPEEILLAQSGKKLIKVTLAIDDTYRDKKNTFYFDVNFWEPISDVVRKYTKKGTKILVEGRLIQIRREKKDQNGNKVVSVKTEVVAEDLILLSPKPQEEVSIQENSNLKHNIDTSKQVAQSDIQSREVQYQPHIDNSYDDSSSEGDTLDDSFPEDIEDQTDDYEGLDESDENNNRNHDDDVEDMDTNKKF